jgi:hypothetical protein
VNASFAQDLSPDARLLIAASQRPIALSADVAPTTVTAGKDTPSWAVPGTADLVILIAVERAMAQRAGATIVETSGSHVSMLSQPEPTIEAIVAAAGSLQGLGLRAPSGLDRQLHRSGRGGDDAGHHLAVRNRRFWSGCRGARSVLALCGLLRHPEHRADLRPASVRLAGTSDRLEQLPLDR